ncbi:MAG: hypothetical protein IPM95_11290 [Sphingobacteriales bacterium]|nr:hypothetical protein [Sphingobacteriales bacterium]
MCKYKHFAVIVGGLIILAVIGCFTLSYDGNDDQLMQFIVSGTLTGTPDSNIIFQHTLIGMMLRFLYTLAPNINWYVFFLISIHFLSAGMIITGLFCRKNTQHRHLLLWALFFIFLFGYYALYLVAIQYTTTSFLIGIAALTLLSSELQLSKKLFFVTVGFLFCMLIREQVFYLILVFSIPVLFQHWTSKERNPLLITLGISVLMFFILSHINKSHSAYLQSNYSRYISASEIIINRPLNITSQALEKYHLTIDDILLIQNWYGADVHYNTPDLFNFAEETLTVRPFDEALPLFKSFIRDERYMLAMYLLSLAAALLFCVQEKKWAILNFILFSVVFIYLLYNMRIPRRVVSPLLFYISWFNLMLLLRSTAPSPLRTTVLTLLVLLSGYKFYCVYHLNLKNKTNAIRFEALTAEINRNPSSLFIIQSLPLELMKVNFHNQDIFTQNNILFTGWYINTPNYLQLLKQHQLTNLTSGIKGRKDILFLTNSNAFEAAFIRVMQQRYASKCHFEDAKAGFTFLHPRKLVFDN